MMRILILRPGFWGLSLLIDANIAVYLAMVVSGLGVLSFDIPGLIAWGANARPLLEGTGWLRLFTSQFVHGGLFHIATNMYGLMIAGIMIAPIARNGRLILCYLLCGLGGSLASAFVHPDVVSVGASGAIFGLFGMLFSLSALGDARLLENRGAMFGNAAFVIVLNLVLGFAIPGIDWAAHIGGLLTGIVLGVVFYFVDRPRLADPTSS
jgi:rhomboid protease GluP